jgi:6-phosphogluconolactonase
MMASKTDVRVFPTPEDAAQEAAAFVAQTANERTREGHRFTIALSGGTTPRRMYQALASSSPRDTVDWGLWHVFWGDERCVPPDHQDSNYRMAKAVLLDHVPVPATQVHRMRGETIPPKAAADEYERELRSVFGDEALPAFDLILLGMGADGHIASLMPGAWALEERERLVVANWSPRLGTHRITLTLPVINAAKSVLVLVTGQSKATALRRVLEPQGGEDSPLPAALLRPEQGSLHWFVDRAAASLLATTPVA